MQRLSGKQLKKEIVATIYDVCNELDEIGIKYPKYSMYSEELEKYAQEIIDAPTDAFEDLHAPEETGGDMGAGYNKKERQYLAPPVDDELDDETMNDLGF